MFLNRFMTACISFVLLLQSTEFVSDWPSCSLLLSAAACRFQTGTDHMKSHMKYIWDVKFRHCQIWCYPSSNENLQCLCLDPWGARLCPAGTAASRRRRPLSPPAGPPSFRSETLPRCPQHHRNGSVRVSRELQVSISLSKNVVYFCCGAWRSKPASLNDVCVWRSLLYTKVKLEAMCRGPEEALLTCKHMLQIWKSFYNLTNPRFARITHLLSPYDPHHFFHMKDHDGSGGSCNMLVLHKFFILAWNKSYLLSFQLENLLLFFLLKDFLIKPLIFWLHCL